MTVLLLPTPWGAMREVQAKEVSYPRKKIARLSELKSDEPVEFKYPFKEPGHSASLLVKLGTEAGGGVGPDRDIVAYNVLCTHMGGPLMGQYRKEYKAIGPCPFHLTTFDLTRYGMVIAGHATESLPQVVLEVKGDDIYAVGMLGLIYGCNDNRYGIEA